MMLLEHSISSNFIRYSHEERARGAAAKRGGGVRLLSLDHGVAEQRYALEPADDSTPEKAFERSWALTILRRAEQRLCRELEKAGKADLYRQLSPAIFGRKPLLPHRETARQLGLTEDAVKMSMLRLRRRFGKLLRAEVAQTVPAGSVDDEIRYLLTVVRFE
jgi:RNA polymerase sigma-70 factor (ECF subfamily)